MLTIGIVILGRQGEDSCTVSISYNTDDRFQSFHTVERVVNISNYTTTTDLTQMMDDIISDYVTINYHLPTKIVILRYSRQIDVERFKCELSKLKMSTPGIPITFMVMNDLNHLNKKIFM